MIDAELFVAYLAEYISYWIVEYRAKTILYCAGMQRGSRNVICVVNLFWLNSQVEWY